MFNKGDRVHTPKGPGTVAYQRMKPPMYSEPEAVSVVLDMEKVKAKLGERGPYTGTMFAAEEVQLL